MDLNDVTCKCLSSFNLGFLNQDKFIDVPDGIAELKAGTSRRRTAYLTISSFEGPVKAWYNFQAERKSKVPATPDDDSYGW